MAKWQLSIFSAGPFPDHCSKMLKPIDFVIIPTAFFHPNVHAQMLFMYKPRFLSVGLIQVPERWLDTNTAHSDYIHLPPDYVLHQHVYIYKYHYDMYIYIHKACIYIYTWIRLGTAQDSCEMFVLQLCLLSYVFLEKVIPKDGLVTSLLCVRFSLDNKVHDTFPTCDMERDRRSPPAFKTTKIHIRTLTFLKQPNDKRLHEVSGCSCFFGGVSGSL